MKFVFILILNCLVINLSAQMQFKIAHGPYLQEVTENGATVVFLTSHKSFSCVEVKPHGALNSDIKRYYTSKDGLKEAYNTSNAIRINKLEPNKKYDYRIVSKEIKSFEPYKVVFGDSLETEWYTISTINPDKKGGSIFITSDMHGDAMKLEKLLNLADYKSCDAFFYAGDMMNYMDKFEAPFESFIDKSVELFATSIPFEVVRGNHETRGNMARTYSSYFPKKDNKIYGSYLYGDIMVVMLDTGEDKSENHPVYAGLTDYNEYRTEQAEWLKQLINTDEYKTARYHIVISHFPMVMNSMSKEEKMWYGWEDAINKFLPILNDADVDLLISGHTHRYYYHKIDSDNNKFPVLEQGANSAVRLDIADGDIKVKVIDKEGNILKDSIIKADM